MLVLMGDFNGRLQRGAGADGTGKPRVGAYTPHRITDKSGARLLDLMREFDLFAPQTFFKSSKKSKRGTGNATYVMEKQLPETLDRHGSTSKRGRWKPSKPQAPALIDMILMPARSQTSVTRARVCWGPTMLRHGYKCDHGMVEVTFRFKIKKPVAPVTRPDYKVLDFDEEVSERRDAALRSVCRRRAPETGETLWGDEAVTDEEVVPNEVAALVEDALARFSCCDLGGKALSPRKSQRPKGPELKLILFLYFTFYLIL